MDLSEASSIERRYAVTDSKVLILHECVLRLKPTITVSRLRILGKVYVNMKWMITLPWSID